jgi:ferredoxin
MRVVVDLARCERHGLCTYAAPDVFALDDDGELHYDPNPPEHLREQVQDAVIGCPVGAISLLPDAGQVPTAADHPAGPSALQGRP